MAENCITTKRIISDEGDIPYKKTQELAAGKLQQ